MSQTLVRIDAPHFVAGILCDDTEWRVCVKAAPIVRWMVGKPLPWIEGYCQEKGWLLDSRRYSSAGTE